MRINRNRIEPGSERGQAMTEFAIILPTLCVLLFGIIQFGIVWNNYVTITDASRAGARKAAVSRRSNPADAGCNTVRSSAGNLDWSKPGASCAVSFAGDTSRPGADVTVSVTYPYEIDLFGIPLATGTLETETTERME